MSGALAYHDGRLVAPEAVAVGAWDAGLTSGDGVFETLLVAEARPVDVGAHLERLYAGLAAVRIAIPEPIDRLERVVRRVAAAAPRPWARLRITVTRGAGGVPTRLVATGAYEPLEAETRAAGVAVTLLAEHPVASRDPLRRVKSTSYQAEMLAWRRARCAGAFEGLLVNERGRLVEGTRSNVVARLDDVLVTPRVDDGCLPGTVRRRLLEAGLIREAPVPVDALDRVAGLFLTSSLVGVVPVGTIDGRALQPAAVWRSLYDAWRRLW